MKKNTRWTLYVIAVCAITLRCSPAPVAGGTDWPDQKIVGVVTMPDGLAVEHARVTLFNEGTVQRAWPQIVDSTRTDENGEYTFGNVPPGSYFLETEDDNGMVGYASVPALRATPVSVSLTLVNGATIGGSIDLPADTNLRHIIVVLNTSHRVMVTPNGSWSITGITPGTYTVIWVVQRTFDTTRYAMVASHEVTCFSGVHTTVDSLTRIKIVGQGTAIFDDFDSVPGTTRLGTKWWLFGDGQDGGNSTIGPSELYPDSLFPIVDAATNNRCMRMVYNSGTRATNAGGNYGGFGTRFMEELGRYQGVADLGRCTGISFTCKSAPGIPLTVSLQSPLARPGQVQSTVIDSISDTWQHYTIDFTAGFGSSWVENSGYISRLVFAVSTPALNRQVVVEIDSIQWRF